jgi:hypothetical protein
MKLRDLEPLPTAEVIEFIRNYFGQWHNPAASALDFECINDDEQSRAFATLARLSEEQAMPGPISDSYDPEWGTGSVAGEIDDALGQVYHRLTELLEGRPPIYIVDVVRSEPGRSISATLTEREWRLLRFALERARESL